MELGDKKLIVQRASVGARAVGMVCTAFQLYLSTLIFDWLIFILYVFIGDGGSRHSRSPNGS